MTRKPRSLPRAKVLAVDPMQDPMGAFLVGQRPEVIPGGKEPVRPTDAMERITDYSAIAALLSSMGEGSDDEDDLLFELLYLETLVAAQPLKSGELLALLGDLGDDVREGLLPPGNLNLVQLRQRTRRLRQHLGGMAGRVSAALVMLLTTLPLFGHQAVAAEDHESRVSAFRVATSAPIVRVIDAISGQGLAGVTIKSMEEKVLGVTDNNGQAVLGEEYHDTDLMSLEKSGYELALLERSQLAARNIVSMKPIAKDEGATAVKSTPMAHADNTTPNNGTPPKLALGLDHTPQMTPPKLPTMPKAPSIRVPVRPRSMMNTKAQMAAKAGSGGTVAGAAAPMKAALPAHPKPMMLADLPTHPKPAMLAAAPTLPKPTMLAELPSHPKPAKMAASNEHGNAGEPTIDTPRAPESTSSHKPLKPNLPSVSEHPAGKRDMTMRLPARPRKAMQTASGRPTASHPEAMPVSVPKRVPQPMRHATHAAMGAHHHRHHASEMPMASAGRSHYQVRPGDSLSQIAKRFLGSSRRWPEIYALNRHRIHDPALIRAGQTLALPGGGGLGHGRVYTVRPGDSLFKIAGVQLGNGNRWHSIYRMNRDHLRSSRLIFPGQHLTLP